MMNNRNISLESTNTRLTGNIKLVMDMNSNLFLESINSNTTLSSIMFKGFPYNEVISHGENIKNFIDMNFVSTEDLFTVASDNPQLIDTNFENQISTIYKYGCYSEASQVIDENLRFFAPIYLNDFKNWPNYFIIIRQSSDTILSSEYYTSKSVVDLVKSGTVIEIIPLIKLKKIFETMQKSSIYLNFDDDKNDDSVVVEGLDFSTGLYGRRLYTGFSDIVNNETTMTEFNNTISNMFKNTGLIFSNILNLEFAFTDFETDGFANYAGFYISTEELQSIQELKDHPFPTKFILNNQLRLLGSEQELKTFMKPLGTSTSLLVGVQEYQVAIAKFKLNIEPQTELLIYVNGKVDYKLIITKKMIGKTIKETLELICDEINLNYTGEQSTVSAEYTRNYELVLTSRHLSDDVMHLFIDSSSIVKESDIYGQVDDYRIRFKGSSSKTFVTRMLYPETRVIKLKNEYYNIVSIYKYNDIYYYDADRIINVQTNTYQLRLEHFSVLQEKAIIGKFIEHAKIDTSIEEDENFDVLDFDADKYRLFLLNKVSEDSYIGSAEEYFGHGNLTPDEIAEYKTIVSDKINAYFNSIFYAKNYLIKNINITDRSSSLDILVNPFQRLDENRLVELRSTNRLNQFINKWRLDGAVDSYFNPYLMNIALSMRSDNFCSSVFNQNRDIKEHTLHWFIIGSSTPPYFTKENASINDYLGYTKTIIKEDDVRSETIDYYEKELTYHRDNEYSSSWSFLKYDELQETCFTVFKGVKYKVDDKNLDGYRFSVIIKTDIIRETSNGFDIDFIKNEKFKTFTVIVYFYIPEPILTTLEGGIDYFVDRSLFYFSNEIYASKKSQINFGESTISLDLYNKISTKKYDLVKTTTEYIIWNADLGKYMMFIGRGLQGRFRTSFKEILELGGSLTCWYTKTEDDDSPFYGMQMTFSDIVEIQDDGFWCTDVKLHTVYTEDVDGIPDKAIEDNVVTDKVTIDIIQALVVDPNLINTNNVFYYSRHIAKELFTYNKIVSSYANNLRYRSITLANVATVLKLGFINNPYNLTILEPDGFYAPISLYAEKIGSSSVLKHLDMKYMYPMYRLEGEYVPMLKTIYGFLGTEVINKSDVVDYKKFSTILQNDYIKNRIVSQYQKPIVSTIYDSYQYLQSTQDDKEHYINLPWIMFPYELRNFSSVCFNSDEFIIDYHESNSVPYEKVCTFKHSKWLNLLNMNSGILSNAKEFYKNSIGSEITEEAIKQKVIVEFIKKTFMKIYRINTVKDDSGQTYEYLIDENRILISGPEQPYTITFQR